jgi:hypothetical protein
MRAACYFCRTALKTNTNNVLRRNNFVEEILAISRRAENGVSCGKTGITGESSQFAQKEKSMLKWWLWCDSDAGSCHLPFAIGHLLVDGQAA